MKRSRQKSPPLTQSQILRTVLKFRWFPEYQMKVAWPELTRCKPKTDIAGTDTLLLGTEGRRICSNSISTERVYSGQTAAWQTVTLFDGRHLLTGICSAFSVGRQQCAICWYRSPLTSLGGRAKMELETEALSLNFPI